MTLVEFGFFKIQVSFMQPIENAHHSKTICKLVMMKIVHFRTGKEWKMVATVGDGGEEKSHRQPQPQGETMRTHDQRAKQHWAHVADDMFQWVAVDGNQTNRSCPFVMLFMNMFVQHWQMDHPKVKCKSNNNKLRWKA